jgi:hypothetical protein
MLFFRFFIFPLLLYIAFVLVRSALQPKKKQPVKAKPTVQPRQSAPSSFPVNTETPSIQDATFEDITDKE